VFGNVAQICAPLWTSEIPFVPPETARLRRPTAEKGQDPPLASTMDDPDAVETGAEPISADLRHYR
jgi:hypothetical protein